MPEIDTAPQTPAPAEPAAPAEKTFTEAEHKAAVEAAIAARFKNAPSKDEIAELRAKAAKADELEAAQLSETEKALKAAEAAEKRAAEAEAKAQAAVIDAMRARIGAEKGLPAVLVARLSGTDEESIAADADALLAAIPKPEAPGARPGGTTGQSDPFLDGLLGKTS